MANEKEVGAAAKAAAPVKPGGVLSEPPKHGKYLKITPLGNAEHVSRGKVFPRGGVYVTPDSAGWNKGEVEELKKDPQLAIEHFEDRQLVPKSERASFFKE